MAYKIEDFVNHFANEFDEINKEEFSKQRRTRSSYAIFFWFSSTLNVSNYQGSLELFILLTFYKPPEISNAT